MVSASARVSKGWFGLQAGMLPWYSRLLFGINVGIPEVGPCWVASDVVKDVKGPPHLGLSDIHVCVESGEKLVEGSWKVLLERVVPKWCILKCVEGL